MKSTVCLVLLLVFLSINVNAQCIVTSFQPSRPDRHSLCTASSPATSPSAIFKEVWWDIIFSDGSVSQNNWQMARGECARLQTSCCGSNATYYCWPIFDYPTTYSDGTTAYFRQLYSEPNMRASVFSCSFPCSAFTRFFDCYYNQDQISEEPHSC